jgi:GNAT superfamily N-acetyltransferase
VRTNLTVRLIQEEEIRQAYLLERACYTPDAAATLEAFRFRKEMFPAFFWSAWNGDKLAGIANGVLTNRTDFDDDEIKSEHSRTVAGRHLCVLTVAVDASLQRNGVGTLLMKQIIASAVSHGLESIILMCESHLLPFYEQLNFRYLGRSASQHGGLEWHEMKLEL